MGQAPIVLIGASPLFRHLRGRQRNEQFLDRQPVRLALADLQAADVDELGLAAQIAQITSRIGRRGGHGDTARLAGRSRRGLHRRGDLAHGGDQWLAIAVELDHLDVVFLPDLPGVGFVLLEQRITGPQIAAERRQDPLQQLHDEPVLQPETDEQ